MHLHKVSPNIVKSSIDWNMLAYNVEIGIHLLSFIVIEIDWIQAFKLLKKNIFLEISICNN